MEASKCWKMLEFQQISIKWKTVKYFMRPKQRAALKKLFSLFQSPLHPLSNKTLLSLWNRNFLTEIYRNIQTFAFKVLQECSSLASRNDAAHMFFLTPNRNMFAGTFVKSERFLTMLRERIIFNFKRVEVRKMSEGFFWAELYCEISDLFR